MIKLYSAKIYDFTQADYTKMYSLLDCAIKEKIDKKRNVKDRQLSLAGYILLWRASKEIYNKDNIKIKFNEYGKPLCDFCFFNISHSFDRIVCAISDTPVGIDIQRICEIKKREKYKLLSLKESIYINEKTEDLSRRYIEVFAKKEAAVKMLGLSLGDSAKIDVFSKQFDFKTESFDDFVQIVCTENVSIM